MYKSFKRHCLSVLTVAVSAALLLSPSPGDPSFASADSGKAKWIDRYMIYYGELNDEVIQTAKNYQLVILHSRNANLTRKQVKEIQLGKNPKDPKDDVLVLGYISVGEDLRTYGLTDAQMKKDARFTANKTGPRVDPRGPQPDGAPSLDHGKPLGLPSPGGAGFASWYLDDNDRDGSPDRNKFFDVAFVNIGDPGWFKVLNGMKLDSADKVSGLKEIMTTSYGRGLGMDGVFLDTVDTAAPNSYTNDQSPNQSEFEWTAPGYADFLKKLRSVYPNKLILQNRGLFFFDPRLPHYAYNGGKELDYVLFESYRLDSNTSKLYNSSFFLDNKFSVTPKLMAEANRPGGFQVLSLGYAEGPKGQISARTLLGKSSLGIKTLKEDIVQAQDLAGFRHYITDRNLTLANSFVLNNDKKVDRSPPQWSSTYNDAPTWPPKSVTPRVGIQKAEAFANSAIVSWDVALDLHSVRYTLYYQDKPFDFAKDPDLKSAKKLALSMDRGEGYANGVGPGVYPYQAKVTGLAPGVEYYFLIRAKDASPNSNEEKNEVWLKAAIPGAQANDS